MRSEPAAGQAAPGEPDTALAPRDELVLMFERLAKDPNASVEKVERLMVLFERNQARLAEHAFTVAMSDAQKEMRSVAADADNPQTKSRYASYKALDEALRPIYTKHGFSLSYNTGETVLPEHIRVLCDVTHIGGHGKPYHVDIPADGKGAKGGDVMTKTHAAGSALSYGMRYLLRMVFGIAIDDDDGNRAGPPRKPAEPPPPKFDEWWADMESTADTGLDALKAAWTASAANFRKFVATYRAKEWEALKARAKK